MLAASLEGICNATSSYIEPWTLKWEQFPKDSSNSATSRNNMILQLIFGIFFYIALEIVLVTLVKS